MKLNNGLTESVYLRNFRPDKELTECVNQVGGFVCVGAGEEGGRVAVGFGGHTESGSSYPAEVACYSAAVYCTVLWPGLSHDQRPLHLHGPLGPRPHWPLCARSSGEIYLNISNPSLK